MQAMKTSQNFESAYQKLNLQQKIAVDTIEGPVMVLAGPGTGKTQVLAMRIGKILIETQVNPSNILCLTYTETGAFEMRQRLIELLGKDGYYVRVHTFHSFCNEIISENPDRFLNLSGLEPLDDVARILIFREIIEQLSVNSVFKPFGDTYYYIRDLTNAISNLKREGITPQDFQGVVEKIEKYVEESRGYFEKYFAINAKQRTAEDTQELLTHLKKISTAQFLYEYLQKIISDAPDKNVDSRGNSQTQVKDKLKKFFDDTVDRLPKQKELINVYREYQKKLTKISKFDYEDMLLHVASKFDEDPILLGRYQEQFQYILTDEFQDTNGVQNKIMTQLGSYFDVPNIFVVGDDDQSIYRFQGASLENILGFWKKYGKEAKIISLSENYRSTQLILDASDSLIVNNETRVSRYIDQSEKKLHSNIHGNNKIKYYKFDQEREEDYFVATEISKLISQKVEPKDIAVIYRNNSDADGFVDLFLRLGIPFRLFSGKNVLDDPIIYQLLRLIKFIGDFSQSEELFFILHSDFLNFKPMDIARLTLHTKTHLWEKIGNREDLEKSGVEEIDKFLEFNMKLTSWQKMSATKTFEKFFEILIKETGLLDLILKSSEKLQMLNRLNTIFEEIKKLNRVDHHLNINSVLEHFRLLEENNLDLIENPLETDKNAVSLLTAHRSKGLEFSHVFITRLVDKKWGNTIDRSKVKLPLGLLNNQVSAELANEDERRLFYVAMTRAKKNVYLTLGIKGDGLKEKAPSMFISEINSQFVQNEKTEDISEQSLQRLQTIFLEPITAINVNDFDWLKEQLKDYKLSVTHLNNYLSCPRLWYYQNFLRVPATKDKNAVFGTAVHLALRDLFVYLKDNGKPLTRDQFIDRFTNYLTHEVLTDGDLKDSLEFGRKHLSIYYDFYRDQFNANSLVEYDFSSHGVNVDGVPIVGKLDKIEIIDSKKKLVKVVDYKTGNPDNKSKDLKEDGNYRRQIIFYQLLCDLSPRFEWTMASGELDFIQGSKKTGGLIKHNFVITPEEKTQLSKIIKDTYEEIISLKFLSLSDDRYCGECDYCRFLKN